MANGTFDDKDVIRDLYATAEDLSRLDQKGVLGDTLERLLEPNLEPLGKILGVPELGLRACIPLCTYLCILRCQLVCFHMLGAPQEEDDPGLRGLHAAVKALGRIAEDAAAVTTLVRAVEKRDSDVFRSVLDEHKLTRFAHLICFWICTLDCRLHCEPFCLDVHNVEPIDLVTRVQEAARAIGQLEGQQAALKELHRATATGDVEAARKIFDQLGILRSCHLICFFLCIWHCFWICLRVCREFPLAVPREPVPALQELARRIIELAESGALEKLHHAFAVGDSESFRSLLHEHGLTRFCHWICLWICHLRCRVYCRWVCRPDCEITEPAGCEEEQTLPEVGIFKGIEIRGTAAGAACGHYTLEWREAGASAWRSDGILYPGGNPQGICGVVAGVLGWLSTYPTVPPGPVEIRLCLHPQNESQPPSCCSITFELQRRLVWIRGIEGVDAEVPPGVLDPGAPLVDGGGDVRSFGSSLRVFGTAWVGGCDVGKLRRYTLSFHSGFVTDPTLSGFTQFWQVDFDKNAFQEAYRDTNPINEAALTSVWKRQRICLPPPFGCLTIGNTLQLSRWNTQIPVLHHVEPVDPPGTPSPAPWTSKELPQPNCQSGRYTLRLTVEDTSGNVFHDLQQIWIDNKDLGPEHARISGIGGIAPCDVVNLSQFAVDGGNCALPWPAQLFGVAYDDYIEEGNSTHPSDNFGGFSLWVKKDGSPDPGTSIPIPGPGAPPWGGPFAGTSRVGTPDPSGRCANPVPPASYPPGADGILALLDMRRFDADCNPDESTLTLQRGECCDYVLRLKVWDDTICPALSGGHHEQLHTFPFRLCNDLS